MFSNELSYSCGNLPNEVDDPIVLGVEVGQAAVVLKPGKLRQSGGGAVRRVGKEGGGLRRIDIARKRIGRLKAQSLAPLLPHVDDQGVVPGIPVALLELNSREVRVGPGRGGWKEQRSIRQNGG